MPRKKHPLAPTGRRPLVRATHELVERACAKIAKGLPIESALVLEGVSRQMMARWRERNPLVEIQFQQAEAKFEEDMLRIIHGHTAKDPKSAQWLIERRMRGDWAPVTKTEVSGKDGGAIQSMTLSKVLLASVAATSDPVRTARQAVPVTPAS